jgi:hypothetical protein
MTKNANFKRRVRQRAAKTGESYAAGPAPCRPGRRGRPCP